MYMYIYIYNTYVDRCLFFRQVVLWGLHTSGQSDVNIVLDTRTLFNKVCYCL